MSWWQKKWVRTGGLVLAGVCGVYALVYIDVLSRARESYQQAEKYMDWRRHPENKRDYFEKKFQSDKIALDAQLSAKKISEPDYKLKLDALIFDRDFAIGESSLKYAYQWYKDTYELFSPPESRWVRQARAKTPEVLEMWKQELRQQNIPFEETMFE